MIHFCDSSKPYNVPFIVIIHFNNVHIYCLFLIDKSYA